MCNQTAKLVRDFTVKLLAGTYRHKIVAGEGGSLLNINLRLMKKLHLAFLFLCLSSLTFSQSSNFNEGLKALEAGDEVTALENFSKDISDNPKNSVSYYYRATIYYNRAENANAMKDVNAGISFVSSKEKRLKAILHELRARIYTQLDELEKAMSDYTTAIKNDTSDPDFYIGRGQLYRDKGMLVNEQAEYAAILKFDETNAAAHALMARSYIGLKNYAEADKLLSKLKKLHPEYDEAYYFSAISAFNQKNYNQAIEDSFKAFVLDDSDDSNRDIFIEYSAHNYPLALARISTKVSEEPENAFWIFFKGILQKNAEAYTDAISLFTRANSLVEGPDAIILSYRALCYNQIGLQQLAIDDFNTVLSIDSTRVFDLAYRGDAKRLLGDYKGAIEDFTTAITMEPTVSWFYYRRGWIYEEFLKNNQAGLYDYSKAIELDSTYVYTYIHRGRFYKNKMNDPLKATADFNAVIRMDTVIAFGSCRHYALLELGREKEAIEWMNKLLEKSPSGGSYYDATCLYSLMNKPAEAVKYITLAFENGYKGIVHLNNDDDLDNVRTNPAFKEVIDKWSTIINEEIKKATQAKEVREQMTTNVIQSIVLPMQKKIKGTYEVACKINGLPLNFIFDTGASDISISQTEVQFMLKNNYLSKSDIRGNQTFMDATGAVSVGTKILLRKVEIGEIEIKNVEASVVHSRNAPLLFGQSALGKYAKIIIDNESETITISTRK